MAVSKTVDGVVALPAAFTLGPTSTPTVTTSTGTSTSNLNCPSCCSNVKYLPGWFGGTSLSGTDPGICPGAVDNSAPVTLYFLFSLTPDTGVNLADLCLPSSISLQVIADDPLFPSKLRFTSVYSSCSTISSPATRLYPTSSSNIWVLTQPAAYTGSRGRLQFSMTACDCSGNTLWFSPYSNWNLGYSSLSCSPFSATFGAFGPGVPTPAIAGYFYQNTVYKGTFTITVTT